MKGKILISAVALMALPSSAWALTVTGRITYLDLDAHQLMLNNSDMYAVAPGIVPTGLEVGRPVTVDVSSLGPKKVITKLLKYS